MRVNDFDFKLPESLIAKYPLPQRSASRLLSINPENGVLEHKQFRDIKDMLVPGDLLVFNDTRVIPARLRGRKASGGRVEVMIERMLGINEAKAHIRASKAPKQGTRILIDRAESANAGEDATGPVSAGINGAEIEVTGRDKGLFLIKVRSEISFPDLLEQYGCMPLPPYIDRAAESLDRDRYQTVFNKVPGAVAAPTAGLHFDQTLLNELADKGIEFAFVTLHVGAGTFQPVRVENIDNHKMHKEYLEVGKECCRQIITAKAKGNKVVAVGTTAVRALETAARQAVPASEAEDALYAGKITPYKGDTEIFIYPGYEFSVVDAMITNFHLPKSTLLMLVSAFAGRENILRAYQAAIAEKYRFFSYGDAMILYGR